VLVKNIGMEFYVIYKSQEKSMERTNRVQTVNHAYGASVEKHLDYLGE